MRALAALQRKKVRETEGRFLVEGLRTCEELLASRYETDILLYCPARLTTVRGRELVEAYRGTNTPRPTLTLAPILLVIGYCVLIPFAIIYTGHPKNQE